MNTIVIIGSAIFLLGVDGFLFLKWKKLQNKPTFFKIYLPYITFILWPYIYAIFYALIDPFGQITADNWKLWVIVGIVVGILLVIELLVIMAVLIYSQIGEKWSFKNLFFFFFLIPFGFVLFIVSISKGIIYDGYKQLNSGIESYEGYCYIEHYNNRNPFSDDFHTIILLNSPNETFTPTNYFEKGIQIAIPVKVSKQLRQKKILNLWKEDIYTCNSKVRVTYLRHINYPISIEY